MKRSKLILIGLFIILVAVNYIQAEGLVNKRCFEDVSLDANDADLVKIVKNAISEKSQQFDQNCIDLLVSRGFYKAAVTLFEDYFVLNGISLAESTMRVAGAKKRDLEKFMTSIWSANQAVQQIEPTVKWAQSKNNIFLHVKLSMRQDSPACIHCKIEKVEITNSSLFSSSYGIQSHQPLRFLLNLTLFDEIDAERSTWKEDSVGTLFFNLTKAIKSENYETESQNNNQAIQDTAIDGDKQDIIKEDSVSEKKEEVPASDAATEQAAKEEPVQGKSQEGKLWLRLEKQERKKEFQIWWDMRDRYRQEMDEWDKMCAQERELKKKRSKSNNGSQSSQKEDL